jgi:hypothetical protein
MGAKGVAASFKLNKISKVIKIDVCNVECL